MLAFDRDIVSPLINLGWLAVALLSAYCIGRPYGLGPQALIGGAIALGAQILVEFQAGEALNDITGVAFVLAAVAHPGQRLCGARGPAVRGAPAAHRYRRHRARGAGGRRASPPGSRPASKLSFLAPVAALTVGVIVIAPRTTRLRTALVFGHPDARRGRVLVRCAT